MSNFETLDKAPEDLDSFLFTVCLDINYNGKWANHWDTFDSIIWKEGESAPSESEFDSKLAELTAEYESTVYARSRKADYPDWSVQLNKIYDDGLTKWKAEMVDPVKTKWPKDNSGPVE